MANTVKTIVTCDAETGEIIQKRQYKYVYWDEDKGYMLWAKKNSVRIFPDIDFPADISKNDLGCLLVLSRKMLPSANMLVVKLRRGFREMNLTDMQEIINLKPTQFKAFMRRMNNAGMIRKVTVESGGKKVYQYYMNPIYFFTGKYLSLNLYLIWRDELDRFLPIWIKDKYYDSLRETERRIKGIKQGEKHNADKSNVDKSTTNN